MSQPRSPALSEITNNFVDKIISRRKEENLRQFTSLMFLLKKKSILFTHFSLLVVPIPWKNIKPIIMLRRLVGNRGSLPSKNLKNHVSIPMQELYSNCVMYLVMKPLSFPLVKWYFSDVVY